MDREPWIDWDEYVSSRAATGTLVSGLVIAGIGVVLLLDRLGIVSADILWRLWPMIFCVIGIVRLTESTNTKDQMWGAFLVSIGALFTLNEFGYIRFGFHQLWPLFLIAGGFLLAFHSHEISEGRAGFSLPSRLRSGLRSGPLSSVAFFGGVERRLEGVIVDGGDILALFGGFKIDLTRADIDGERLIIDATAIFGGGEIILPEWWRASVEGVGIFGGYVDKTRHIPRPDRPVKTVVIRGAAVFGGIEVKSY